jgi:hypothetical protein
MDKTERWYEYQRFETAMFSLLGGVDLGIGKYKELPDEKKTHGNNYECVFYPDEEIMDVTAEVKKKLKRFNVYAKIFTENPKLDRREIYKLYRELI